MLAGADGDCVRVFFFGGLTEVDVAGGGLVMIGDGWMVAVFRVRSCVMCCLGVSGRVCADGGDVSFSWQGGGRRTGVRLLVGLAAGAEQRAQAASCFQPSSFICWSVEPCERFALHELGPSRLIFSKLENRRRCIILLLAVKSVYI